MNAIRPYQQSPNKTEETRISSPRILLIEDNPGDSALIRAQLRQAFGDESIVLDVAECLGDAVEFLQKKEYDIVTVDLNLPDSEGLEAVEEVRKQRPEVAVVVLTGWADRELALNALRVGAQDYIIKGSFDASSLKWNITCAIARQRTLNQMDSVRRNEVEKNELKDRVLSMTAHDIRGSIVGVLGFLRSILDGEFIHNLSPEQRRVFELMHKNCADVVSLSDEIVQARRVTSSAFRTEIASNEIKRFLIEALDRCRDAAILKSIKLELDFENAPEFFNFDARLLSRALKNLILNAIKFSPTESTVKVCATTDNEGAFSLSVSDQGPGIPAKDLDYIFDELSPLKLAGTIPLSNGLGLVIVKRIAEAHGGTAWVKSTLGEGSIFGICIPKS